MAHDDFFRDAEDRLFEGEGEVFAKVVAALCASTTPACAEDVAEAEQVSEDVGKILEAGRVESTEPACTAHAGVTELVIARTLLGVAEHGVGFAALFEALFGFRIVRIAVGVVLHREFAIRTLDLDVRRGAVNAEDFVVVSLGVGRQGYFSVFQGLKPLLVITLFGTPEGAP